MPKRANYRMVAEDDPQWVRFWDAYPRHVSKKDARKAWAQIDPSPELVDTMIAALEWQIPAFKWDGEKADFAPYPASWLNAERWKDERRKSPRFHLAPTYTPWRCEHLEQCGNQTMCAVKDQHPEKYPLKVSA